MQAYSIAGGVFLLTLGQYFFFTFPEWCVKFSIASLKMNATQLIKLRRQIYGGIGLGVAAAAVISILALSNVSFVYGD